MRVARMLIYVIFQLQALTLFDRIDKSNETMDGLPKKTDGSHTRINEIMWQM